MIKIAAIGIGRAGCTIVSKLPTYIQEFVDILYIHSQEAYLLRNNYNKSISIEISETKYLGTRGETYLGHKCAKYNKHKILSKLSGYELIFVSGLGGGTGSGATPYIAKILKDKGALCISIVSLPFDFEGERKSKVALSAYSKIKRSSDSVVLIDNNTLLESYSAISKGIFDRSDKFISTAIYGLASPISRPDLVNIDMLDVKQAIQGMGVSTVGIGTSRGKNRATLATNKSIENAQIFRKFQTFNIKSMIVSITAGMDMDIKEFDEIGNVIRKFISDDTIVVVGTIISLEIIDSIEIVTIASGFVDSIDTNYRRWAYCDM
jgi:cell division protein FtsZ